jgi:hypothetical protein
MDNVVMESVLVSDGGGMSYPTHLMGHTSVF